MRADGTYKNGAEFEVGLDNPGTFTGSDASNIVFYSNTASGQGQWDSVSEDDTCSFYTKSNVHYVWVVDNTAWQSGGDGVAGGHNANRTSDHYYIGRNTLYQHRENCVDIKEINNLIVSGNVCHTLRSTNSSAGEGIVVHYGQDSTGSNDAWVMFNTVYDVVNGIVMEQTNGNAYMITVMTS
jgi:hypothetical protein